MVVLGMVNNVIKEKSIDKYEVVHVKHMDKYEIWMCDFIYKE